MILWREQLDTCAKLTQHSQHDQHRHQHEYQFELYFFKNIRNLTNNHGLMKIT